jgi:hypothetical protein
MPEEYFENRNQYMLDQVIFLLAARKFKFTTTAVFEGEVKVE